MFQWKHTKYILMYLSYLAHEYFASFLKVLKNVESSLTILWNCLPERCFKLHSSFNRLETGWTRKTFSFFVAASRKISYHISVKNHNAEVKLCNLYQFAEVFNGIASSKIFCPSFSSIILQSIAFGWCSFYTKSNTFWYWLNSLLQRHQ